MNQPNHGESWKFEAPAGVLEEFKAAADTIGMTYKAAARRLLDPSGEEDPARVLARLREVVPRGVRRAREFQDDDLEGWGTHLPPRVYAAVRQIGDECGLTAKSVGRAVFQAFAGEIFERLSEASAESAEPGGAEEKELETAVA